MQALCKSDLVRHTCSYVVAQAKHVSINQQQLKELCQVLDGQKKYIAFESYECHISKDQGDETVLQYLFALDTLNFCFWPVPNYEYEDLAQSLKQVVINSQDGLSPKSLLKWGIQDLREKVFKGLDFPLIDERLRLLQETAQVVLRHFGGQYSNLVKEANNSTQKLLEILTTLFSGFQDHAIYNGRQIFMYKRSQILIGDIYAALQGKGLGHFTDIDKLTMFPDYRVPQILRHHGVLDYTQELHALINSKTELPHGSQYEVEIRAATVIAVEQLRQQLGVLSIEVDWILWQLGEQHKDTIEPHHRTLSIYY